MRGGFPMVLFSFGLVALGFGITTLILGTLGSHFGTPHKTAPMTTIAFILAGVVLVGSGLGLSRSRSKQDTTR
ncbi:MAG TPA: hypothetical protein VNC11_08515 [Gemmatimonadaceae bacterium]|nr:hypothetical protein [Gemmatimonadaceae bacterium]